MKKSNPRVQRECEQSDQGCHNRRFSFEMTAPSGFPLPLSIPAEPAEPAELTLPVQPPRLKRQMAYCEYDILWSNILEQIRTYKHNPN